MMAKAKTTQLKNFESDETALSDIIGPSKNCNLNEAVTTALSLLYSTPPPKVSTFFYNLKPLLTQLSAVIAQLLFEEALAKKQHAHLASLR